MAQYDPEVIQEFAEKLYVKARRIIAAYMAAGFLVPVVTVWVAGDPSVAGALLLGVVGGVIGYQIGKSKAFELKLEAQRALTQVRIEVNTKWLREEVGL